jgi:hypothetical protein
MSSPHERPHAFLGDETWSKLSQPFDTGARQFPILVPIFPDDPAIADNREAWQVLRAFKAHLEQQPFLMGRRPGASDFGTYGQLTQLTQFDPTPMAVTLEEAPRVYAWVDVIDDLSGLEPTDGDWLRRDDIPDSLRELLREIGRVYVPAVLANARALSQGADRVETTIDGQPWVQQPFPYQGKCVQWVREEYAALAEGDRAAVDKLLDGTGCEELFTAMEEGA